MNKVCLNILYRKLDLPLTEKIELLYQNSFDKINHIMPLYNKGDEVNNIIPVFESKYQLSGYVAQAYHKIYSNEYDYYIFMSDRCLLNPQINSKNIEKYFKVDKNTSFISDNIKGVDINTLCSTLWAFPSIFNMAYSRNSAEILDFIPQKSEARKAYFEKTGIITERIYSDYLSYLQRYIVFGKRHNHPFYFKLKYGNMDLRTLTDAFVSKPDETVVTVYPVVCAEADFFIIPNNTLKMFAHYCGLLAAVRLHHNIAFSTALCFSADRIRMPKDINNGDKILDLNRCDADDLELRRQKTGTVDVLDRQGENILMAYPIPLDRLNFTSNARRNG